MVHHTTGFTQQAYEKAELDGGEFYQLAVLVHPALVQVCLQVAEPQSAVGYAVAPAEQCSHASGQLPWPEGP
jgi:hypothetical protein